MNKAQKESFDNVINRSSNNIFKSYHLKIKINFIKILLIIYDKEIKILNYSIFLVKKSDSFKLLNSINF